MYNNYSQYVGWKKKVKRILFPLNRKIKARESLGSNIERFDPFCLSNFISCNINLIQSMIAVHFR